MLGTVYDECDEMAKIYDSFPSLNEIAKVLLFIMEIGMFDASWKQDHTETKLELHDEIEHHTRVGEDFFRFKFSRRKSSRRKSCSFYFCVPDVWRAVVK